jgi:hypothetical protein
MSTDRTQDGAGVYTQTNDPGGNQIIAYRRAADGTLTPLGAYDTGGLGTGKPHLASQGSVVLSDDGRWLFTVNAGSDDLSVFAVAADGLALVDRVDAGGMRPISIAVHQGLLYVLSTGGPGDPASLHGFTVGEDGRITPLDGSARQLSQPNADPAQVGFSPDGATLDDRFQGVGALVAPWAPDVNLEEGVQDRRCKPNVEPLEARWTPPWTPSPPHCT